MRAQKITPKDCFRVGTQVNTKYSSRSEIVFVNNWSLFDVKSVNPEFRYTPWAELSEREATIFFREEGEFAESSICGLQLGETMVFFDEDYDLREEFYSKVRSEDVEFLSSFIRGQKFVQFSEPFQSDSRVWFITSDGMVYFQQGGTHKHLHNRTPEVQKVNIVAAGRVNPGLNTSFVWQSDLLRVSTPDILKPYLEEYLKNLKVSF